MENLNRETNQNQSNEFWQAEVIGHIYDTNFNEIAEWINEGAIQSSDKVRRGNLRWINAGKVPAFVPFFNARENGVRLNDVKINHIQFAENDRKISSTDLKYCFIHEQEKAGFVCEICGNNYCQNCFAHQQNKDCPICGAYCRSLGLSDPDLKLSSQPVENENFGSTISDIKTAQKFDSPVSLPSDVLKTKTKGINLFFVIFFALSISGLVSYLWAYKYNPESESVLESLTEVAALDTKFKTDLEVEKKKSEHNNAQKKRKEELRYVNENQIYAHGAAVHIRKEVNEIDDQMAFNKFTGAENIIRETHSRERAKIIGNYQDSRSKRNFIEAFFVSFVFTFSGLLTVRYFTKR